MENTESDIRAAEASALSRLYRLHAEGVAHGAFGKAHGIGSAGMVWQYLNGHRPLNMTAATKFARGLGVPIDAFSPRLAEEVRSAVTLVEAKEPSGKYLPADLSLDQALRHLPRAARMQILDLAVYKLDRAGQEVLSRQLDEMLQREDDDEDDDHGSEPPPPPPPKERRSSRRR